MRKLLLVDDSTTFTRIVDNLLKNHFQVVGFGRDGAQGYQMYKQHKPDLVLLDITMPNVNGKDCLSDIVKENPSANVIMVSSIGDEQTVNECLKLGAKGFVNKESIKMGDISKNPLLKKAIQSILSDAFEETK